MPRRFSIEISSSISDAKYADVANAVWMLLRSLDHTFTVQPDGQADRRQMDAAWEQYGKDASWTN